MWHLDTPVVFDKSIDLHHSIPPSHVLGCHVRIPNNGINLVKIQLLKSVLLYAKTLFGINNQLPAPYSRYIPGT